MKTTVVFLLLAFLALCTKVIAQPTIEGSEVSKATLASNPEPRKTQFLFAGGLHQVVDGGSRIVTVQRLDARAGIRPVQALFLGIGPSVRWYQNSTSFPVYSTVCLASRDVKASPYLSLSGGHAGRRSEVKDEHGQWAFLAEAGFQINQPGGPSLAFFACFENMPYLRKSGGTPGPMGLIESIIGERLATLGFGFAITF